ncbi:MAG: NAD(P)-dependent oxidoreductase [Gammaproteobacteria bacterium]|nr:NAD(P)-dependent oxidoreductase [Gammaproteobacteria bacterium]
MNNRLHGTIAVTGLTGFIGGRLSAKLLDLCADVRAIVRSEKPLRAGIRPWRVSLGDVQGLREALAGVDAVVHLAGAVRGRRFEDFRDVNIDAVANLCTAIDAQAQPPSLLLVSSLAARQPELSDYASSKRAGEEVLGAWPHLDHTILRPPAVYGPGEVEMRPLFDWMRRGLTVIPGNRNQRLAFLHVDDLAEAIIAWLRDPGRCRHGRFEIDDGTPDGYDWPAIACAAGAPRSRTVVVPAALLDGMARVNLAASKLFGYAPMLTPGKVRELTRECWTGADGTFGTITGWRPRYDLTGGLQQMYDGG